MADPAPTAPELAARLGTYSRREDELIVEEFGTLQVHGRRLVFLSARPQGPSRKAGVVVAHSLFEFKMLQSAEVALARSAAVQGFPSIYIQAPGMGDSEGSLEDCMIQDRVDAVVAAAAYVREQSPELETICFFGARMGAAIAALAARQVQGAGLIMWDPALEAADYWKQSKRFARVVATLARHESFVDPDEQLREGDRASFLGYTISRRTLDDLEAMDSVAEGSPIRGPILVVSLNDQMLSGTVASARKLGQDVEGVSLGRPKPRHVIHMGMKEAAEAVGATMEWMNRRIE